MQVTDTKKQPISKLFIKIVVVNVINLLVFLALFMLLRDLPNIATAVKKANSANQTAEHSFDSTVLQAEVDKYADKTKIVESALMGDQTVISFVSLMDQIKEKGILTQYDFPINQEVTDKTGFYGLPVIATIVGTKQQVSETLISITNKPLLVRPVTLAITIDPLGTYTAKYGVFLYTR